MKKLDSFEEAKKGEIADKVAFIDSVTKTEGMDTFLVKVGIDSESFDPYSNEADFAKLEKTFKTFNEQKEAQKGAVEFLREHFKKESGVELTDEQLKSVTEQIEQKAISNPEDLAEYVKKLKAFQENPKEIAEKETEMEKVYRDDGGDEKLAKEIDELRKKARTLELAAESGVLQSFFARFGRKMETEDDERQFRGDYILQQVKKAGLLKKLNAEDQEFLRSTDTTDIVGYFVKKDHRYDDYAFRDLVENLERVVLRARKDLPAVIDAEKKRVKLRDDMVSARKKAKEEYNVAVPSFGKYYFNSKKVKTAKEELEDVKWQIELFETKQIKVEELRRLREQKDNMFANLRLATLDGFLDAKEVAKEVKIMAHKKIRDLMEGGVKDIKQGGTAGATSVLDYVDQLEKAGSEEGGTDYFEGGIEASATEQDHDKDLGYKSSADRIRASVQISIERVIADQIGAEIDKISKNKPDALAEALKKLLERTATKGVGNMPKEEISAFVGTVIADRKYVYRNDPVKILNLNLALAKLRFEAKKLNK